MNKKILFALWGGLFALCAGLGFIPEPTGFLKFLLAALSVGFFVPGFLLLRECGKTGDRHTLQLVRNLSALSLAVTLALLIANFLSVLGSETLGSILYYMLVIVSSPMVCGQYWVLSLFLWACLMIASGKALKKK
ncbi:MAG: hypothetical protein IJ375_01230 [Oscillospiraceae bacterium]|nr:hypothetical protein [Oscillospiraceae bacterium]